MKQNVIVRKRNSVKKGVTYEYRFETASIGGQRKWISKGGFEDENTARIEGIKALNNSGVLRAEFDRISQFYKKRPRTRKANNTQ